MKSGVPESDMTAVGAVTGLNWKGFAMLVSECSLASAEQVVGEIDVASGLEQGCPLSGTIWSGRPSV